MKVKIQSADFAKLIGKIQSVVPTKPSVPILGNVLIEANDSQFTINATDLKVSMRAFGRAQVLEPGAITLPARRLFQLARELTISDIEIECPTPQLAVIKAGTSNFKIQGMDKSEFPTFADFSDGVLMEMKAETLKEMLTRTVFAAAKDDSRQTLNGVLMQRVKGLATFVGTDGKRLARNHVVFKDEIKDSSSCILPLKAVEEIVKMLDDKEEIVKLTLMPEKLSIEANQTILMTKLLSGQYPDVSRVIPQKSKTPITLHRTELISLLKQVSLFTSDGSHSVRFTFQPGSLELTAISSDIGEGKASMPANYAGTKLEIAFNPHYFLDILRHSKDETVQFEVNDSYNPGLITDSSEAEFVIMPMRLEG